MKKRIYIFPTFACTLNCPRCYQKQLGAPMDYKLKIEYCRLIFQRLDDQFYRADELIFTGGEPTLWPHLREAIEMAHVSQPQAGVRIVTNGFRRTMQDYGSADVVQVSDYGAVNRMDQYRLKKEGGCRVKIQTAVQWDWDIKQSSDLPGVCGCSGLSFVGERVWACAMAAAAQTPDFIPIEQDFALLASAGCDPHYQELCRSCLVNRKNRKSPKPVFQFSIWESRSWLCG